MNNHTPEPWYRNGALIEADNGDDFSICARVPDAPGGYYERSIPNANRIVACVNGCKGIPDPETTVLELVSFIEAAEGALASLGDHGNVACAALAEQARALLAKLNP